MTALNALVHETIVAYRANADVGAGRQHLGAALCAADLVKAAVDVTKHGTFGEWYDSDRVFGLKALPSALKTELDRNQ